MTCVIFLRNVILLTLHKIKKSTFQLKKHYQNEQNHDYYDCVSFGFVQNLPGAQIKFFAPFRYGIMFLNEKMMYCYDKTVAKKAQNNVASLGF